MSDQISTRTTSLAIFILGPPGSGKTDVAKCLQKILNLHRISGGDLLRKLAQCPNDPNAWLAQKAVEGGHGADDGLILELYERELSQSMNNRIVFDGNPSGESQARRQVNLLHRRGIERIACVVLRCPFDLCRSRIIERATKGQQRADDCDEEIIKNRFNWYHGEVKAAAAYLRTHVSLFLEVDASDPIHEIANRIVSNLNVYK